MTPARTLPRTAGLDCSPTGLMRGITGDPDRSPAPKGLAVEEELQRAGWHAHVIGAAGLSLEALLCDLSRAAKIVIVELNVKGRSRLFLFKRAGDGFDTRGPCAVENTKTPVVKAWVVTPH